MRKIVLVEVTCNLCKVLTVVDFHSESDSDKQGFLSDFLEKEGWTFDNGADFCPVCSPIIKRVSEDSI